MPYTIGPKKKEEPKFKLPAAQIAYVTNAGMPDNTERTTYTKIEPLQDMKGKGVFHNLEIDESVDQKHHLFKAWLHDAINNHVLFIDKKPKEISLKHIQASKEDYVGLSESYYDDTLDVPNFNWESLIMLTVEGMIDRITEREHYVKERIHKVTNPRIKALYNEDISRIHAFRLYTKYTATNGLQCDPHYESAQKRYKTNFPTTEQRWKAKVISRSEVVNRNDVADSLRYSLDNQLREELSEAVKTQLPDLKGLIAKMNGEIDDAMSIPTQQVSKKLKTEKVRKLKAPVEETGIPLHEFEKKDVERAFDKMIRG